MVRAQIGISLDAMYAVQLNKLAEIKGMPVSSLVREMLDRQAMLVLGERNEVLSEEQQQDILRELSYILQRYRTVFLKIGKNLECPIQIGQVLPAPAEAQEITTASEA